MGWCGLNGRVSKLHKILFRKEPTWEESCHQHDCDYIYGGRYLDEKQRQQLISRWQSDKELYIAVRDAGWPFMACIYWVFVRCAWWKWKS